MSYDAWYLKTPEVDIRSPRVRVKGDADSPKWVSGTELQSP